MVEKDLSKNGDGLRRRLVELSGPFEVAEMAADFMRCTSGASSSGIIGENMIYHGFRGFSEKMSSFYVGDDNCDCSFAEVLEKMKAPDVRAASLAVPGVDDIGISRRACVRRVRRGLDCGDDLDVERWAALDYGAMFEDVERVRRGAASVRIVADLAAPGVWCSKDFEDYAGIISALVEVAENAGVNVAVDFSACCEPYKDKKGGGREKSSGVVYDFVIPLKRENEFLDKNLLLFCAGGVMFSRAILHPFYVGIFSRDFKCTIWRGLGRCKNSFHEVTAGAFVVDWRDVSNGAEVVRLFVEFLKAGENV